jgi:TrpR family trp operon transcriptional repressor
MDIKDPRVQENLQELCTALAAAKDPQFIEDFLRSLLTPAEVADVAARWALVKALEQKVPQRVIAKNYHLSLCKITRGSKELKKPDAPFRTMLALSLRRAKRAEQAAL